MKRCFIIIFILLFLIYSQVAFSQIDEKFRGKRFCLMIEIWPESIRPKCSVVIDSAELKLTSNSKMKNIFKTKEYNNHIIGHIKIKCDGYYTFVKKDYKLKEEGKNILQVLLSKRVSFIKMKKCDIAIEQLKWNYIIKFKNFTLPDSIIDKVYYRDVDVGILDDLLIVDAENNKILNSKIEYEDFDSPEGMTIDSEGNTYISDWGNHRIVVFDTNGEYKYSFGGFGKNVNPNEGENALFIFPTRIAIEEGIEEDELYREKYIWVSDRYGIHKVDSQGHYLETVIIPTEEFQIGTFYAIGIRGYGTGAKLYLVKRKTGKVECFAAKEVETD